MPLRLPSQKKVDFDIENVFFTPDKTVREYSTQFPKQTLDCLVKNESFIIKPPDKGDRRHRRH